MIGKTYTAAHLFFLLHHSVLLRKVSADDGDGEGKHEHATDEAAGGDDLSGVGGGEHVAIANRGAGDDDEPERAGNRTANRAAATRYNQN